MDAARHQRVKSIFAAVCDCEPSMRAALLARECGNDIELRRDVEALLAHDDLPRVDLESAARNIRGIIVAAAGDGHADHHDHLASAAPPIERIGDYRVLSILGEGGMGVVYLAEQDNPRRTVALKVIKPGITSTAMLRRFEHEAHVLGRLQHPGIAQIYEAGTAAIDHGAGVRIASRRQPFFVMEYVRGQPLLEHAAALGLGTRQRIELLIKIAHAAHYAHLQGIVHRDLKPSNILVDVHGQPKILDFGVARSTDADLQVTTLRTDVGQLIGTIPYMSPEQIGCGAVPRSANGHGRESHATIDARSDIYALGVIAYELLAGRLPHDVRGKSIPEAIRIIGEHEPARLSSINRYFRGDLDTIVSKALEKDPDRRYQSAAELALDFQRYLDDQPIIARPPSAMYQFRKFAKRNKPVVAAATAVFIALLGSLLTISIYLVQATIARDIALEAKNTEKTLREIAERKSIEAARQAEDARQKAYLANVAAAQAALEVNDINSARRRLEAAEQSLRNWEWRYLSAQLDDSIAQFRDPDREGIEHPVYAMTLSPDERELYAAYWDRLVRRWNIGDESIIARYEGHEKPVESVAITADGKQLISGDYSGRLIIRSTAEGSIVHQFEAHPGFALWSIALSPDGTKLATIAEEPVAKIWSTLDWSLLAELRGHVRPLRFVRFSPDGSMVATSSTDGTVRLWNPEGGESRGVIAPRGGVISEIDFSPDGTRLAIACFDFSVRVWNIESQPRQELVLRGHTNAIRTVAWSSDGRRLASGGQDFTVRIWDVAEAARLTVFTGHTDTVNVLRWSRDGSRLFSGSIDGGACAWPTDSMLLTPYICRTPNDVLSVNLSPDGESMFLTEGNRLSLRDAQTGDLVSTLPGPCIRVTGSRDGRFIAGRTGANSAGVWNATTGELLATLEGHAELVIDCAFNVAGDILATAAIDGSIVLWKTATWSKERDLTGFGRVHAIEFHPDNRHLAIGCHHALMIVDLETGEVVERPVEEGYFRQLSFSPDGSLLATIATETFVRLWNGRTGEPLRTGPDQASILNSLAWTPDGSRLASGAVDGTVWLCDTASWQEVAIIRAHSMSVQAMAFSPDGSRLVTGSRDRSVRIWDTQPLGEHVAAIERRRRLLPQLEPAVAALLREYSSAQAAQDAIECDTSLSTEQRRIMRQLVIRDTARMQDRSPVTRLSEP